MNTSFGPAKVDKQALRVIFGEPFAANQILSVFSQTQRVFMMTSGQQFLLFVGVDGQSFRLMIATVITITIAAEITITDCR